jgi:hypothetical protein
VSYPPRMALLIMAMIDGDVKVRVINQVEVQPEQMVADTCSTLAAGDSLFLTPATPAGDEGPPKTFLPALGRQRNDSNRASGDILYRAKSGHNVNAQTGYQATFCFQHPLSPSTDQRGTPTTPCFRRT